MSKNITKEFKQYDDKTIKIEVHEPIKDIQIYKNYSFNVGLAQKYGINEAIILQNLIFWIEKNQANEVNYYDGYYWTFNSIKAFQKLFPFWTERQIRYILKSLEEKNIIKTGNYNKSKYDKTLWYTIIEKSLLQFCHIDNSKKENRKVKSVEPIPDINTNINTNIYNKNNKISKDKIIYIVNTYPTSCPIRKTSTRRSVYNRKKLITIIQKNGMVRTAEIIRAYINDCEKTNTYIMNFSTFVNNFPSLEDFEKQEKKQQKIIVPKEVREELDKEMWI